MWANFAPPLKTKTQESTIPKWVTEVVAVEFSLPECGVVLGQGVVAFWAAMPETAVHEYRHAFADEGNVGTNKRFWILDLGFWI